MAGPLKKFRAGQITCALWENEAKVNGRSVRMLMATVERRYPYKGRHRYNASLIDWPNELSDTCVQGLTVGTNDICEDGVINMREP